jgi:glycosyltransferase involved in cell wall biosynthesis
MKVCHLTTVHPWHDVRIFEKECVSLSKSGFEVYLLAMNCESKQFKGVNVIGLPCTFSGRISRVVKARKVMYAKAVEMDADVYHIHDPELLTIALKLKRKGKVVIYDAHEDVPRQILGKYWIPKFFRKTFSAAYEKFENYIASKLDAIITATPTIRERFLKINPLTVDVNNYPILSEVILPSGVKKKNAVCYVGSISFVRGISSLVDAMDKVENIQLILAGPFSPLEYQNDLSSMKGWRNVDFRGYASRNEVYEIMNESVAGVVTLLPLPNYLDSLPIKMFEYMSAGIPVIASDFPLFKEIVEQNGCGICVDPENPEAIAKAIHYLIENPSIAEQMGKKGKEVVEKKCNWTNEEKKLVELYRRFSK